jgi:hypothetical protein
VPFVGDLAVPAEPKPIPVVLKPGRRVRLRVTDASGDPVAIDWPEGRADGLDYRFDGNEMGKGEYLFRNLPAGKVRIIAPYAGKRLEVVAGPSDGEVKIEVPATGSAMIRFEGLLDEPVTHQIRLTPVGGDAGTEVVHDIGYVPNRKRWAVRIPAVLPGTYRISLEHWVEGDDPDRYVYETCRSGGTVTVTEEKEGEGRLE